MKYVISFLKYLSQPIKDLEINLIWNAKDLTIFQGEKNSDDDQKKNNLKVHNGKKGELYD